MHISTIFVDTSRKIITAKLKIDNVKMNARFIYTNFYGEYRMQFVIYDAHYYSRKQCFSDTIGKLDIFPITHVQYVIMEK